MVAILSGRKSLRAIARYGQDYPEVLQPLGFWSHKPYRLAHTTLKRMLEGLDITYLARVLGGVLGEMGAIQTLVLDGKRLRGSQENGTPGLHLLEAFVAEGKRILGGVQVEGDAAFAERGWPSGCWIKFVRGAAGQGLDLPGAAGGGVERARWGIEKHDFLVRDVTFAEDRCRVWGLSNLTAALERFAARPFELLARLGVV
ncbi:MAG: hypothetical protein KatS3mg071_1990 [Meiothermus sp.]|nr:MAG: hypothetical protein KatS3mg071_1990 [Meiothermus sp.]